ncbi:enoyl-ACP reductase FabI [Tateyamaria sp.]|jgi:enoyl-[acyl-carrier protein] reductase I|uniref:enoyl-ACP reductase FabI n=1 Tax=Tateyamaria sp. TaxID=1929288 RepID=UPI0032DC8722
MNSPTLDPVRLLDMTDKKGLIVGVANEHSLAWAAARNCHAAGADLALTYLNEKARPFVEPLAQSICAPLLMPCDVAHEGELETVFAKITETWGKLDFLVHAIAWAPADDLHGRLTDCSAEGFTQAMQVSCHSFIRMAKLAEPLMHQGGNLTTLTFIGAERVVDHYSLMGPVKAALETSVRYLAHELGPKGIRVNAISAGAIKTRAASGIEHFDELIRETETKSPLRRTVTADEVGRAALLLASDHTTAITGEILHVDAGFHVDGMVFH